MKSFRLYLRTFATSYSGTCSKSIVELVWLSCKYLRMPINTGLESICRAARNAGNGLDLSGCSYGYCSNKDTFIEDIAPYYYFLGGLVLAQRCTQVLELGTHYGGSIAAMDRAAQLIPEERKVLVTIDKAFHESVLLNACASVYRIHADCLASNTLEEVTRLLSPPIDLLFLDAHHTYEHTLKCIELYGCRLKPALMVIDDICLNNSMAELWKKLLNTPGWDAFDCSPYTGPKGRHCGFGIVRANWDDAGCC